MKLLLKLLLCTSCVGLVTGRHDEMEKRNQDIDYRYTESGTLKWCVYCMQRDFENSYAESECVGKVNWTEVNQWGDRTEVFYPICGTLITDSKYYRYVKNCTHVPVIEGAEVDCRDQNGDESIRVHDTCRVSCTAPRTIPSQPVITCEPRTATWTPVSCILNSCQPLRSVFGEASTSCDLDENLTLNTTCKLECHRHEGYDSAHRLITCLQGEWKTVEECPPLSGCPPLKNIKQEDETTKCNISKFLPTNTTCEISCSEGYSPRSRVMVCNQDKWQPVSTCAPQTGNGTISPYVIGGAVILVFGIIMLIICCLICRKKAKKPAKAEDQEAQTQWSPLMDTSSQSLNTGSVSETSEQTSLSYGSEVTGNPKMESLNPEDPPPPYMSQESHDIAEHNMDIVVQPSFHKGNFAVNKCNKVQIYYTQNKERQGHPLPESCEIQVAEGSRLTIYAVCADMHRIHYFYCGPTFIHDQYEEYGYGVSFIVSANTAGNYLLCAKCAYEGEVVMRLLIRVTDNPDETYVKQIYRREDDFDSLDSTVSGPSLTAGSEPSKELQAMPFSLPSNPDLGVLVMPDDTDDESDLIGAVGGTGGAGTRLHTARSNVSLASRRSICDENDEARECTLLLSDLQKQEYKKVKDEVCLKIEPHNTRKPDRTIFGATLSILGFSVDRVEHVVWAKREDLRNTPATVLMSMMMQAGKRGGHLVRYFSQSDCHHPDVVDILKQAHPNCPFCKQY